MNPKPILEYIEDRLIEENPPFNWKVTWVDSQKTLELIVHFSKALEDTAVYFMDDNGKVNNPKRIHFSDKICLYDPDLSSVKTDRYLVTFVMNYQTGVEKGYIDAIIKQLKLVIIEGMTDFSSFVDDDNQHLFELSWPEKAFSETLATLKTTQNYDKTQLSFFETEEEKQSFFQALLGGENNE